MALQEDAGLKGGLKPKKDFNVTDFSLKKNYRNPSFSTVLLFIRAYNSKYELALRNPSPHCGSTSSCPAGILI